METMVVVDYGAGNIHSMVQALKRVIDKFSLNINLFVTDQAIDILRAHRIVLPGVGAFSHCLKGLHKVKENLIEAVLKRKVPFLGVCIGMHMLATWGNERGKKIEGLGWISGSVTPFPDGTRPLPHMGWNVVKTSFVHNSAVNAREHPVLVGIDDQDFYFAHSYIYHPEEERNVWARCFHGCSFPVVVGKDNYLAVQCHPEKSGAVGERLLENFCRWNGKIS